MLNLESLSHTKSWAFPMHDGLWFVVVPNHFVTIHLAGGFLQNQNSPQAGFY
jgi:hypothetical protein